MGNQSANISRFTHISFLFFYRQPRFVELTSQMHQNLLKGTTPWPNQVRSRTEDIEILTSKWWFWNARFSGMDGISWKYPGYDMLKPAWNIMEFLWYLRDCGKALLQIRIASSGGSSTNFRYIHELKYFTVKDNMSSVKLPMSFQVLSGNPPCELWINTCII